MHRIIGDGILKALYDEYPTIIHFYPYFFIFSELIKEYLITKDMDRVQKQGFRIILKNILNKPLKHWNAGRRNVCLKRLCSEDSKVFLLENQ